MDTRRILTELRAERSRIDQAIAAIQGISSDGAVPRRGRPSTKTTSTSKPRRRRRMTAAGRKRLSEMMKQRWAERKKKVKGA